MERADIELIFSNPNDAVKAKKIAEAMITVFYQNDREWLPFDDMEKENADGWLHYPGRYVEYEDVSALKWLWYNYRDEYRKSGRRGKFTGTPNADAEEMLGRMKCSGAYLPEATFEGMRRATVDGYAKRYLTHAAYDGSRLTFEQMEGMPVYAAIIVAWTREEDKFVKSCRKFPFVRVELITEDCEAVEQDAGISDWIRGVNDVKMEMVSAQLKFMHASYPFIRIDAASTEICEKYARELEGILEERGFRYRSLSF